MGPALECQAGSEYEFICEAQGGMREPTIAGHTRELAAPHIKAIGVVLHSQVGTVIDAGAPLMTVHAESRGELEYALRYACADSGIVRLEENS